MNFKWFCNLKIENKLKVMFLILFAIIIAIGLVGIDFLRNMKGQVSQVYQTRLLRIESLSNVLESISSLNYDIYGLTFVTSDTMQTNGTMVAATLKEIRQEADKIDREINIYEATPHHKREKMTLDKVRTSWQEYLNRLEETVEKIEDDQKAINGLASTSEDDSNPVPMNTTAMSSDFRELFDLSGNVFRVTRALASINNEIAETNYTDSVRLYEFSTVWMWVFIVLGLVVGITSGVYIAKTITAPVKQVVGASNEIAKGNLQADDVDIDRKDEIGQLAAAFNIMKKNLISMVKKISNYSRLITSSSQTLYESSKNLMEGVQRQSSAVNQTSTSMVEMDKTIKENARSTQNLASGIIETASSINEMDMSISVVAGNINDANELSKESVTTASEGAKVINESLEEMSRVAEKVQKTAEIIRQLGKHSEEIGDIISVIDNIADQTNLLALNAAIEAARAGEHGKGFAVVADEVRKLAERTTQATDRIGQMIHSTQAQTEVAVTSMEEGAAEVTRGVNLTFQVRDSLKNIQESILKASDLLNSVTVAMQEQATASGEITKAADEMANLTEQVSIAGKKQELASEEVVKAIEEIGEVSGQMLDISKEIATQSENLNSEAEEMESTVSQFGVGDEEEVTGITLKEKAKE